MLFSQNGQLVGLETYNANPPLRLILIIEDGYNQVFAVVDTLHRLLTGQDLNGYPENA